MLAYGADDGTKLLDLPTGLGGGMGPPITFEVDGKQHVAWFTLDTEEPGSRGQLQNGWGWLQFCVTEEEGEERLDAIRMEWSRVVTN